MLPKNSGNAANRRRHCTGIIWARIRSEEASTVAKKDTETREDPESHVVERSQRPCTGNQARLDKKKKKNKKKNKKIKYRLIDAYTLAYTSLVRVNR